MYHHIGTTTLQLEDIEELPIAKVQKRRELWDYTIIVYSLRHSLHRDDQVSSLGAADTFTSSQTHRHGSPQFNFSASIIESPSQFTLK